MINYNDAEVALRYLLDTDEEYARAKTLYDALSDRKKTVQALQYGKLSGSATEKNQLALASEEYAKHLIMIRDAQIEYETIKAKRGTNQSIIEMWRSVNSAQKMGNI